MSGAKALPILMYHHVSPHPGLVTISPATFRSHLAALSAAGWRSVGLSEVERFLGGADLPAKSLVITFDDGYLDNYVHAHPILAEFGMHAVLFVVTGWIGSGAPRSGDMPTPNHTECQRCIKTDRADEVMLRWSELDVMCAEGTFEIHSHTHTHRRWDRELIDPAARREALFSDLTKSRATLTEQCGSVSRHLCWPQGYHDDLYRQCAVDAGFDYLYTTEKRVVTHLNDPLQIGRIVTKEKDGQWLTRRARWFSIPWLGNLYLTIQSL